MPRFLQLDLAEVARGVNLTEEDAEGGLRINSTHDLIKLRNNGESNEVGDDLFDVGEVGQVDQVDDLNEDGACGLHPTKQESSGWALEVVPVHHDVLHVLQAKDHFLRKLKVKETSTNKSHKLQLPVHVQRFFEGLSG